MRRAIIPTLLALAVTMSVARAQSPAADQAISTRVAELDAEAGRYFGLLPSIPGLTRAYVRLTPVGPTLIVDGSAGQATIPLTPERHAALAGYIDEFERLTPERRAELRSALGELAGDAQQRDGSSRRYTITTRDGARVEGTMLAADDSTLSLWTSDEPYDWRSAGAGVSVIPARSVERIERTGSLLQGAAIGLICATGASMVFYDPLADEIGGVERAAASVAWGAGAGLGMYDRTALDRPIGGNPLLFGLTLPALREDALFDVEQPPELRRVIVDERLRAASTPAPAPSTMEEVEERYAPARFSISYASGVPVLYPGGEEITNISDYKITSERVGVSEVGMLRQVGVGYGFGGRFGLSLDYMEARTTHGMRKRAEWFDAYHALVSATYAITPADLVRESRLYLLAKLGAGYTLADVRFNRGGLRNYYGSTASGHLQMEIGSRVAGFFSFFVRMEALVSIPVEYPSVMLTLVPGKADASTGGILFGAALHL